MEKSEICMTQDMTLTFIGKLCVSKKESLRRFKKRHLEIVLFFYI